ncbi:MAG: hypothetical protein U0945_00685, partial [Flavobacterium sp.]|nr:hypothetical protein [Flavobacterium sp.]
TKQWMRIYIWNRLPVIIVRPFLYFIYRYFFRLGFLDGKNGIVICYLKAFSVYTRFQELKKMNSNR